MADLRTLARLAAELNEDLSLCMRCGMCQAVCPLFAETGREPDVARGKLALLNGLARELLTRPEEIRERLTRCLLCGSCAAQCPSGVPVVDLFLKARALLTGYLGLSPLQRLFFRGLLSRPGLFHRLLDVGARLQGLFLKPADDICSTARAPLLSSLLQDRRLIPLAALPLHRRLPRRSPARAPSGRTVAFFAGCLIDRLFPQVGEAVVRLLTHQGLEVVFPAGQGCCGMPALAAGDTDTARSLLRYHLELFRRERCDLVLTACPTCAFALRRLWPDLGRELPEALRTEIAVLAAGTREVSEFLAELGPLPTSAVPPGPRLALTYHDPCHLKKSLGVAAQPRALLQATAGYEYRELPEADRCCGLGGSFGLEEYGLSRAIGARKREQILATGTQVVATACPACMVQLTDLLAPARVQVKHVAEIYAAALPEEKEG